MYMRYKSGFTLLELMVVIAIVAIVAGIAIPSMASMLESSRANSKISDISRLIIFARSQASSSRLPVTLCPLNGNNCTNNWANEISVFEDPGSTGTLQAGRTVLRVISAVRAGDKLNAVVGNRITFSVDGSSSSAATFHYCPSSKPDHGLTLLLTASGRTRSNDDAVNCG